MKIYNGFWDCEYRPGKFIYPIINYTFYYQCRRESGHYETTTLRPILPIYQRRRDKEIDKDPDRVFIYPYQEIEFGTYFDRNWIKYPHKPVITKSLEYIPEHLRAIELIEFLHEFDLADDEDKKKFVPELTSWIFKKDILQIAELLFDLLPRRKLSDDQEGLFYFTYCALQLSQFGYPEYISELCGGCMGDPTEFYWTYVEPEYVKALEYDSIPIFIDIMRRKFYWDEYRGLDVISSAVDSSQAIEQKNALHNFIDHEMFDPHLLYYVSHFLGDTPWCGVHFCHVCHELITNEDREREKLDKYDMSHNKCRYYADDDDNEEEESHKRQKMNYFYEYSHLYQ